MPTLNLDLHPPDDYSHRFFIWHEWIQANGPLTPANVLEYFAYSMFYDKQSSNQVLRMQTFLSAQPIDEAEELKRFVGIEFAVVHSDPPSFFIIHKRDRLSPDEVKPLAAYFVINNRIYQSPDVYTVLSNRLLTTLYSIQSTMDILRKHRPHYTSRTGFVWPIENLSVSQDSSKKRAPETDMSTTTDPEIAPEISPAKPPPKKPQNNVLLLNAMHTTAVHSRMSFTSSTFLQPPESTTADTPATSQMRSSMTPAPTPQDTSIKAGSVEPIKPSGTMKKRKKRTSLAPPITAAT